MVVFIGGIWYDCQKDGLGSLFRIEEPQDSKAKIGEKVSHGHDHTADPHSNSFTVENKDGEKYHMKVKVWGQPLPQ